MHTPTRSTHFLRRMNYIYTMLFIHQFPDWTHFRYDFKRVLDALGKTRFDEGKLIAIMQLCDLRDVEQKILSEDIIANFAIDDIHLDEDDVDKEVFLRNQGSVNFIKNHLGAIHNAAIPLTEERLFNWHAAMGQNKILSFRKGASEINYTKNDFTYNFKGTDPERIQNEILNFLNWFDKAPLDGVIKAAIAHFWFLTIRPFDDANGRIARTITAMQLARTENTNRCQYSLNTQILKQRNDYMRILCKTQKGNGDLTEWILWFLGTMQQAISASERRFSTAINKLLFQHAHAGIALSEREQHLLNAALLQKISENFTVKEVAAIFGTSHDTALRDIQDLIRKGILQADKKGGRSQSYSLVKQIP